MRNILLPVFLCIATQYNLSLFAQQDIVKGIVTIQNSSFNNNGKISYVQNAQAEGVYVKTKPTVTDENGLFSLKIIGAKVAEKMRLKVQKDGFKVVNPSNLLVIGGQNDTIRIVMAKPEDIEAMRLSIYATAKTTAETTFKMVLNGYNNELIELRNKANVDDIAVQRIEDKIKLHNKCAKNVDELAHNLAHKYSLINLDDASTAFQKAFNCFQKGHLDSALMCFNTIDLIKKADVIVKIKSERIKKGIKLNDTKQEEQLHKIIDDFMLQADMYRFNWAFEQADSMYQLMLKYNDNNVEMYKQYGAFLVEMNDLNRAKTIYEKGLNQAQLATDKMQLMNDLADLQRKTGEFLKAEKLLNQAGEMAEWEIINQKEVFEPLFALSQHNLGKVYTDTKAYGKADNAYKSALTIYQEYAAKTTAKPNDSLVLAANLNSIAINYLRQNNYVESDNYFSKTKAIYDTLLDSNSVVYKCHLAELKNNYAQLFFNKKDTLNMLKSNAEVVSIYKGLKRINVNAFENDYLSALNNLIKTCIDFKLNDKAIIYFDTLIGLQKQRILKHPQQYDMDLEQSLIALNAIYKQQKKYALIDSVFKMRIELHKTMVKRTPQYKPEICQTLMDFAAFCKEQKRYDEAHRQYLKVADMQRELTEKEPLTHGEHLQATLQMFFERYDSLASNEIFEKKIKALRDTQNNYRQEQIEVQIKIVNALEHATIKDKQIKLNTAYSHLAAYYLSVKKIKEAELIAQKQDNNAAHFLVFIYGIQDKYNEAQLVLTKISDKKATKIHCLQWANDFYNQKIITHDVKTKLNKWFDTSTAIGLQGN